MRALIIVDVQVDFCPGGTLPTHEGDEVVPVINNIIDNFDIVLASRDWHPEQTKHFNKWPVHCVQGRHGAEFHPQLRTEKVDQEFLKGTGDKDDGYSAFEATNADLNEYLKNHHIKDVFVCGLATDFCVKETALDCIKYGFETYVIEDAVAGVALKPEDITHAINEMKNAGVNFIKLSEVIEKEILSL